MTATAGAGVATMTTGGGGVTAMTAPVAVSAAGPGRAVTGREVLSNGTYRRVDASGRVLDTRAATGADLVRLRALAGARAVPAATAAHEADPVVQGHPKRIRLRGRDVIVGYTDGWTEAVERGRYRLTDRYGHIAVDRPATGDDSARLRALARR